MGSVVSVGTYGWTKQETNKPKARKCLSFSIFIEVCELVYLAPAAVHFINGSPECRIAGFDQLHLRPDIGLHIRAHQKVVLTPFLAGQTRLGLDHCVNATNCHKTRVAR